MIKWYILGRSYNNHEKIITYLLFSATTLHAVLGVRPVIAMGCGSDSDKSEIVREEVDVDCEENISASTIN